MIAVCKEQLIGKYHNLNIMERQNILVQFFGVWEAKSIITLQLINIYLQMTSQNVATDFLYNLTYTKCTLYIYI